MANWTIHYSERHYADISWDNGALEFDFLSAEARRDGLREDLMNGTKLDTYDPRVGHSQDIAPDLNDLYTLDLWIHAWVQRMRREQDMVAFHVETEDLEWEDVLGEPADYDETGIVY